MNYKSYTEKEINAALAQGKEVWALDTQNEGHDDHLIGSHDEVVADICHHHEVESLPSGWTLERISEEERDDCIPEAECSFCGVQKKRCEFDRVDTNPGWAANWVYTCEECEGKICPFCFERAEESDAPCQTAEGRPAHQECVRNKDIFCGDCQSPTQHRLIGGLCEACRKEVERGDITAPHYEGVNLRGLKLEQYSCIVAESFCQVPRKELLERFLGIPKDTLERFKGCSFRFYIASLELVAWGKGDEFPKAIRKYTV